MYDSFSLMCPNFLPFLHVFRTVSQPNISRIISDMCLTSQTAIITHPCFILITIAADTFNNF